VNGYENSQFLEVLRKYGVQVPALPPAAEQSYTLIRSESSKLKLWMCACKVRVRVAVPDFRAQCLKCGTLFERIG
jgi:hypothetical protein